MSQTNPKEVRRIADAMHEDIADVVAEFLDNHDASAVMLAFLAILPHMIGKALIIFDEDAKRQAIHEFVYALMGEADKSGKAFAEFIERGE